MNTKQPKYAFGLLETPNDLEMTRIKSGASISRTAYPLDSPSLNITPGILQQGASSSISTPDIAAKTVSNNECSGSVVVKTPAHSGCKRLHTSKEYSSTNTPYTSSSTVSNNHDSSTLVAVVEGRGQARGEIGIASIDLRQPVLMLSQFSDIQMYTKTLAKMQLIDPLEIILPNTLCENENNSKLFTLIVKHFPKVQVSSVQRRYFNESKGLQYIKHLCAAEYKSIEFQISAKYYCLAATAALLKYVEFIQNIMFAPNSLKAVFKGCEHTTMIDSTTVKNLELLQNMKDATSQHTLFGILNFTKTIGGCRLLRSNVLQPPNDEETIRLRQDAVLELTEKGNVFFNLQSVVSKFVDIGHIISVCVQIPKQETVRKAENKLTSVILLKHVLQLLDPFRENLSYCENQLLKIYCKALEDPRFKTVLNKINEVIDEGTQYHKGLLQQRTQKCMAVKSQINGLLDVARRTYSELVDDMESYIRQLAESHKLPLRTTHSSLRGFHIQMSRNDGEKNCLGARTFSEKLPSVFVKVSKFKNILSFTTMDLLQLNERMKTALDEIYRMTNVVVTDLLAQIHEYFGCLYQLSDIVAMTDMLLAFTSAATLSSYVCPEFTDTLAIKQGLHPIMQKMCTDAVVPNDTYASEHSNVVIITGPNMGGKSTYLRQVALLQIMAQMGSFVPAQYASFRIANQIFSRIGSDDDMESNSSTFTLEMKETNYILQYISDSSLVIVDELGRGTSAEEGVGICWAIAEHLLKTRNIGASTMSVTSAVQCMVRHEATTEKAYTFFVTHFKQLTGLNKHYANVANYYFEVQRIFSSEANCEKVSYTHVLSRGVTPETCYGLQLVELSTMPFTVILDAKQITTKIEAQKQGLLTRDSQFIQKNAVFNLAARLIQVAKNSRMDDNSVRVYLKSVYRSYIAEVNSVNELTSEHSNTSK